MKLTKEQKAAHRAAFRNMSPAEKLEYVWEYYSWPILLTLLALGILLATPDKTDGERLQMVNKMIADYGIKEEDFLSSLDDMVEHAFDDQCTGANPRYPLMSEMKAMYLEAYYGQ